MLAMLLLWQINIAQSMKVDQFSIVFVMFQQIKHQIKISLFHNIFPTRG